MIFNHVNEFEYHYDFYFGNGIVAFDMGAKKLGPLFPILNRIGIPLRSGKELKKSIDEINDYLKISNIIFYPEGERTFSDIPKIYNISRSFIVCCILFITNYYTRYLLKYYMIFIHVPNHYISIHPSAD
jgi:hypothetical protein